MEMKKRNACLKSILGLLIIINLGACAVEPVYQRSYVVPQYSPPVVVWGSPVFAHGPAGWGHHYGGWRRRAW